MHRNLVTPAALVLLLVTGAAAAQSAATPIPGIPPAPTIVIPPPACDKPATGPGVAPDPRQIQRYEKSLDAYKKCMLDYAHALGDQGKAYALVSNQLVDAGNKAITDFNEFAAEVRKNRDADE